MNDPTADTETPLAGGWPPRRVVLLGASNLTRALRTVCTLSGRHWGAPLDILAAAGHGRSYGADSTVLLRRLPGILECGLWPALAQRSPAPTAALVTDIGNDILYEAPVERIVRWVEMTLARLAEHGARTTVTGLPLCSLGDLSQARFHFFKKIFVPRCTLGLSQIRARAEAVNAAVIELAKRYDARFIAPRGAWYGLDPIHVRVASWREAWHEILSPWRDNPSESAALRFAAFSWIKVRLLRPELRWLAGREQRAAQPCGRLADGSLISLY